MKLSKKKGIENGTKYYSMAGTVTSDAVCAQKVYARGCSARQETMELGRPAGTYLAMRSHLMNA